MPSLSKIVLVIALGLSLVLANSCGGNCPSGRCNDCKCGSAPAKVDIAAACARNSGWSQTCCKCIIEHESGGNSHAQLHNTNGSDDVGLWQVNSMNWASCNGGAAPCTVDANLACAKKVFAWGGNTWKLWSTCGACGCCGRAEEEAFMALEQSPAESLFQ
eukprot:403341290